MRRLAVFLPATAFCALAAAGCATLTASAHIERGVDFTSYATYEWSAPDALPTGDPRLDSNPFFEDRLQGAIERALAAKGFERAPVNQPPDLLIHHHAAVNQKVDVYTADRTSGTCYQDCQPQVVDYEQGTLMLDIVDARTNKVIWRGWAQDSFSGVIDNQDRLDEKVEAGVGKMMQLLPRGGATVR